MRVLLCLVVLTAALLAEVRMNVEQIRAFITSSTRLGHSDKQIADYVKNIRMIERLDLSTVEDLAAGPRTTEALKRLVETSKALPGARPPAAKPVYQPIPAPDDAEQLRVLDAAREYAREQHIILLCGHYEGVDQRVADHLVDDELSIGDYVLTNGALAALVVTDAIVRLIPGVLGDETSNKYESFAESGLLEHPQYTRPPEFRGKKVPDILLSGNHQEIARWREEQSRKLTRERRSDLL